MLLNNYFNFLATDILSVTVMIASCHLATCIHSADCFARTRQLFQSLTRRSHDHHLQSIHASLQLRTNHPRKCLSIKENSMRTIHLVTASITMMAMLNLATPAIASSNTLNTMQKTSPIPFKHAASEYCNQANGHGPLSPRIFLHRMLISCPVGEEAHKDKNSDC